MKTKLNLTIDSGLVPQTKHYAKKQGKSVSQLVEDLLRKVVSESEITFSKRWKGKFKISDGLDSRTEYLKSRYDL